MTDNMRRAILLAGAWAAPTAIVSVATPAFAGSPVPGLSGLMQFTYTRPAWGTATLELTTVGSGLGLKVDNARSVPTLARLTICISNAVVWAGTAWNGSGGGWTKPTFKRTEGAFSVFETTYQGSWTKSGTTYRTGDFTWTANVTSTSDRLPLRVVRDATVDGQPFQTDSGVVYLQARTGRRAEPAASDNGGAEAITLKVQV